MRSLWLAGLFTLLAVPAAAQGLVGRWSASVDSPNGSLPLNFEFEVKGNTVTGIVSNDFMPEFPIEDGVLKGGELSFKLRTQLVTFLYRGPVTGDSLTLKSSVFEERSSADVQGPTLGATLRSITTLKLTRRK